jgi:hypothetical protein
MGPSRNWAFGGESKEWNSQAHACVAVVDYQVRVDMLRCDLVHTAAIQQQEGESVSVPPSSQNARGHTPAIRRVRENIQFAMRVYFRPQ